MHQTPEGQLLIIAVLLAVIGAIFWRLRRRQEGVEVDQVQAAADALRRDPSAHPRVVAEADRIRADATTGIRTGLALLAAGIAITVATAIAQPGGYVVFGTGFAVAGGAHLVRSFQGRRLAARFDELLARQPTPGAGPYG